MEGDSSTWLAELNSNLEQELATYPQSMRRQYMVPPPVDLIPARELLRTWPIGFWAVLREVWSNRK